MSEKKKAQGPRKPLCIIGTAATAGAAPYDEQLDGEEYIYDIWAINTALTKPEVKRVDVCFEMHPKRYWGIPSVTQRLREFDGPVIMQDHYDDIPNSVAYPHDEIKTKYHLDIMGQNLYVTNTIVWMLLKAIEDGYTDISLYGVHMSHETEYAYQRSSCSWVIGMIHGWILDGKPYKLYLPPESQILKAEYEYGFDEPTKIMQYLQGRLQGLKNGVEQGKAQTKDLEYRIAKTEGAVEEANHIYKRIAGLD